MTTAPHALVDLLADGIPSSGVTFLPTGESVSHGHIWDRSSGSARWLAGRINPDCSVAAIMASTPEAIACLYGCIRSGHRLVSLPTPPRAVALDWYVDFLRTACKRERSEVLLVDRPYVPLLADVLGVEVIAFDEVHETHSALNEDPDRFVLVQFSSGSTGDPKGIELSPQAIAANIVAIIERLDPTPGDIACSWLPLSHDMGLIGMTLAMGCSAGSRWANGGQLVLITPEAFMQSPEVWLRACSEYGATFTAGPDFALNLVASRAPRAGTLDLSRIRAVVVGAEPVRASTLRGFAETFEPAGFEPGAFCPAYGLAEASLAVTLTSAEAEWHAKPTGESRLGDGDDGRRVNFGKEIVSAGPPLAGTEVDIDAPEGHPGRIRIRSASLLDRYTDGSTGRDEQGWFVTSDVGFVDDGELYVVGRADDVLLLNGRKVYVTDIEDAVAAIDGLRAGTATAFMVDDDTFAVVAEPAEQRLGSNSAEALCSRIRGAVVGRTGVAPDLVLLLARDTLPKTASGKPQRYLARRRLIAGELTVVHERRYR